MFDLAKYADQARRKKAEIEEALGRPETLSNPRELPRLSSAHRRFDRLVKLFDERESALRHRAGAEEVRSSPDAELAAVAEQEVAETEALLADVEQRIRVALLPPEPGDEKNIIMEIRAGTGGEEAALFAGDLARAYQKYCEARGWRMSLISATQSGLGGFKEAIFNIEGENVYSQMKFESGTHRVQRVPVTESAGRIHTSAVTVAVLPEAEDVDIEIRPDELRIDTFHATGPGGQSVNTTDSAVRITHIPTGLIVSCQDEKSQHKNKAKALKVLRARLLDIEQQKQEQQRASERQKQIGTGDRSQRIRTYNFPENRLTDHRVNFRSKSLDLILQGDLQPIIDALVAADQTRRLDEAAASAELATI